MSGCCQRLRLRYCLRYDIHSNSNNLQLQQITNSVVLLVIMTKDHAVVEAAVERLQRYTASLREDVDSLVRSSKTNTESSKNTEALRKIKYWFGLLMETVQTDQVQNVGFDCKTLSELLSSLLRILDDTDIYNLQIESKAKKPARQKHERFQQDRRRRLPIRSSDLVAAMHESQEAGCNDINDDTLYLGNCAEHPAKKQKCAYVNVSLKDVLNAKAADFHGKSNDVESQTSKNERGERMQTTALLLDAAILRRDVYQLLLQVDIMNVRKVIRTTTDKQEVKDAMTQMVLSHLGRVFANPTSPSMRLSTVMGADCLRENGLSDSGYNVLLDNLLHCTSLSNSIYIRFYGEIVSECHAYASPSRLLRALIRLMKESLHVNGMLSNCEGMSQEHFAQLKGVEESLLQATSQIIVRRNNILHSLNADIGHCVLSVVKLYSCYKRMVRRISGVYDKVSCWTNLDNPTYSQEELVSALQGEGVLSLFCWDESDDDQSSAAVQSDGTHHLLTLRSAHDRLGPCLGFDNILSHPSSYTMKAKSIFEVQSQGSGGLNSAFYGINGDLLHDIFAFLGYRSLARASTTCRNWNLASNDQRLWINLYFRKYKKSIFEEEYAAKGMARLRKPASFDKFTALKSSAERKKLARILVDESNYDWRYIFKRKYQSEKHVSKTFLRCEVIGCVARFNKRSANAHKKVHEKIITSRATASLALRKLESNVISLRKKVLQLDNGADEQEATNKETDEMRALYMNSPVDVMTKVFSFLYVRDLLKPVCKMWKKILTDNDTLWQSLYSSHFESLPYFSDIPENWSACFRATFNAEKRRCKIAKYDSLGWRTKICPVAGCCTVLYNQLGYSKHVLIHEQQMLIQRLPQTKND